MPSLIIRPVESYRGELMKIANDLRWMNSGPLAGLGEIELTALNRQQYYPGKVNPLSGNRGNGCSPGYGNDATITIAGQSGTFQLNVMLPVIAYNILQSIDILGNVSEVLPTKPLPAYRQEPVICNRRWQKSHFGDGVKPHLLVTKKLLKWRKQPINKVGLLFEVAAEMTALSREDLEKLLEPAHLTQGGINE